MSWSSGHRSGSGRQKVGTRGIVLRKRVVANRICKLTFKQNSYRSPFLHSADLCISFSKIQRRTVSRIGARIWCKWYLFVQVREGTVIGAGGSVRPVVLNRNGQLPITIQAQRTDEKENDEMSGNKGEQCQSWKEKEQRPMKATPMAYYSYHILDRRNEFSTMVSVWSFFKQMLISTSCTVDG